MLPQDVIGPKYEPPSDAGSGAVAGRSGEYLARWSSQFYGATFAVHFPDSILGALALNSFSEMLRKHYDAGSIRFHGGAPRVVTTGYYYIRMTDERLQKEVEIIPEELAAGSSTSWSSSNPSKPTSSSRPPVESALGKDWLRPEEDEQWKDL